MSIARSADDASIVKVVCVAETRYEDRRRELTQYSREYDEAFQARDWQTVESWPADRDPNAIYDFEERTSPIVDELVATVRSLIPCLDVLDADLLTKVLAKLDEEASK